MKRGKWADLAIEYWSDDSVEIEFMNPVSGKWEEYVDKPGSYCEFDDNIEYRKKNFRRYRVASFYHSVTGYYIIVANTASHAALLESTPNFDRWLTDWVD